MIEKLKNFISRLYLRFKRLTFLIASWAVLFSTITILGLKIGVEYDDGISFTTPAYRQAEKYKAQISASDYWNFVNRNYKKEKIKVIPSLVCWFFKAFGFKIYIVCSRGEEGSDALVHSWRPLVNKFVFVPDAFKKYELLEKEKFFFYFASSDEDIIQAKKAKITVIRIKRGNLSENSKPYHPGKYGEWILPLSAF